MQEPGTRHAARDPWIPDHLHGPVCCRSARPLGNDPLHEASGDRKSTRLNSSHVSISYAVFCLKKKNTLLESVMSQTGLDQSWSLLFEGGSIGLPRGRVIERVRSSLFLLNVMDFLKDDEILTAA